VDTEKRDANGWGGSILDTCRQEAEGGGIACSAFLLAFLSI
jgi:hypothetical protein